MAGIPAAAADDRAALSASSSVRNTRVNSSSRALGSGSRTLGAAAPSVTGPTLLRLAHTFLGVDDLRAHDHLGEFAERRDELRPVRRVGVTEMVGNLVQHDEFPQRPCRASLGHRYRGAVGVAFVVRGGEPSPRPDGQLGDVGPTLVNGPEREYIVDVALHGVHRPEPGFRRQGEVGAEEVDYAVAVFARP